MAYKNKRYAFALLAISPLSMAQDWNGTVLGFEVPPATLLGDMLGVRNILYDNGFTYNLGYLNELGWSGGGGYNHDPHVAYIDQFALTFN